MKFSIIVAVDENNGIGFGNGMPWGRTVPADMQRFVRKTTKRPGTPVIMGRKNLESMPGPLKNRRNIVLSRQPGLTIPNVEVCGNLQEAIETAIAGSHADDEGYIIGGGQIYEQAIGLECVTRIDLTRIHGKFACDTFFPKIDPQEWRQIKGEDDGHVPVDEKNKYAMDFLTYERFRHVSV